MPRASAVRSSRVMRRRYPSPTEAGPSVDPALGGRAEVSERTCPTVGPMVVDAEPGVRRFHGAGGRVPNHPSSSYTGG